MAEIRESVYWFDTDSLPPSTNIHYNTEGILALGLNFAKIYLDSIVTKITPVNTLDQHELKMQFHDVHSPKYFPVDVIFSYARREIIVNTFAEHLLILYGLSGNVLSIKSGFGHGTYTFTGLNLTGVQFLNITTPQGSQWQKLVMD